MRRWPVFAVIGLVASLALAQPKPPNVTATNGSFSTISATTATATTVKAGFVDAGTITSPGAITSSAGNNATAFGVLTEGARIYTGPDTYLYESGTTLTSSSSFSAGGGTLTAAAGSTAPVSISATGAGATLTSYVSSGNNSFFTIFSNQTDSATAKGVASDTFNTFSTTGAKLHLFNNNGTNKSFVDLNGYFHTSTSKGQTFGSWSSNTVGVLATGTSFLGCFTPTTPVGFRNITASWAVAGVSGTIGVVVRIRNVTDSTTLCTCTLGACTTAANTPLSCDCNSISTAGKTYCVQYDPTAVTGTDCATDPSGTFATVEMTQ